MAHQNRVTPRSEIIAHPGRGLLMGNRGILHDAGGRPGKRRWTSDLWIACALSFKDWHRPIMAPHTYTELFFLDEAVAFAAGHRPCAECRRGDYNRFRAAWAAAGLGHHTRAPEIDACLHRARLTDPPRRQRLYQAALGTLPDGSFITLDAQDYLVKGPALYPYTPEGYAPPRPRPALAEVTVLTPAPLVAVLAAGYVPLIHPSAA